MLTLSGALASVKTRLDIPSANTTFDAAITEYLNDAANRLYPAAAQEVASQLVTIAPDNYGDVNVDLSGLSTPVTSARIIEISAGYEWLTIKRLYHHGTNLRIRGCSTDIIQAKIYGLNPYVLTTVPDYLAPAVYWYAMSEFYDYLVGNKRKYNLYSLASGAHATDDMSDKSTFYSDKADAYVEEHATAY